MVGLVEGDNCSDLGVELSRIGICIIQGTAGCLWPSCKGIFVILASYVNVFSLWIFLQFHRECYSFISGNSVSSRVASRGSESDWYLRRGCTSLRIVVIAAIPSLVDKVENIVASSRSVYRRLCCELNFCISASSGPFFARSSSENGSQSFVQGDRFYPEVAVRYAFFRRRSEASNGNRDGRFARLVLWEYEVRSVSRIGCRHSG